MNDEIYNALYAGWGKAEAEADFALHGAEKIASYNASSGGGGGGGYSDAEVMANAWAKTYADMLANVPEPYENVNPFAFDEALAREASTKEYSPYYDETLADYTSKIEKYKARSVTDLKDTLAFLSATKDFFTGATRRALDKAERSTNEGYAGRGLYFSGVRGRDIEELRKESSESVGEYMLGYNYKTKAAEQESGRAIEDWNLDVTQKTRDINREKDYAIESGILTRKGEAKEEWLNSEKKYYSQYPAYYQGLYS